MRVSRLVFLSLLLLCAHPAAGQTAQPYLLSEGGGSFGDGGSAPAAVLGFGYLTPRNVGFEIEVSYVPELDFGDLGIPRIAIFPPVNVSSSGRIVSLQTHVVGILPGGGTKLRAFLVGGGGIADVRQRIRVEFPTIGPILPGFPGFPFDFDFRVTEHTQSETSLVLSAGAGLEYGVTDHLGLGLAVRYQRVFSDPRDLDLARVGVRATWRF